MSLRIAIRSIALLGVGLTQAIAQQVPDLTRLLDASGNVSRIQEVSWSARGEMFDPAQTIVAGSRPRHVSSYSVEGVWEPVGQTDYQWNLNIHYPFPSALNYSESMSASGDGQIDGSDGFRPSAVGPLPPARVGARAKFLAMTMPAILLAGAEEVTPIPGQSDSYEFVAMDSRWRVHLDVTTGVPTRLSTTENDPLFGTVESVLHYADWRDTNGVLVPGQLEYRVDGQLIQQEQRGELDLVLASRARDVGLSPPLDVPAYSRGWNMAHWFLRRIALGGPADTDQSYPVDLLEVGDGVYQVLGSSHHSLVIETADGLVIADAPLYPSRSVAVLEALAERWPGKPVQRLILTHHHYDHSGGVTAFAAAGIPITTHSGNTEFFTSALARQGLGAAPISGVGDQIELSIGGLTIGLYDLPTSHVAGMLMVYLPDQRLVFNADLYSPGRETQHQLWASEFLQAVRVRGLAVDQLVGAHGRGGGTLQELEQLVGVD